jgi:hypothetical protein
MALLEDGYFIEINFGSTLLYTVLRRVNSGIFLWNGANKWEGVLQNYALNSSDFPNMSSERLRESPLNLTMSE